MEEKTHHAYNSTTKFLQKTFCVTKRFPTFVTGWLHKIIYYAARRIPGNSRPDKKGDYKYDCASIFELKRGGRKFQHKPSRYFQTHKNFV
jgi:hypothetical protein